MTDYRIYKVDRAGKIVGPALMVQRDSDKAVVATARGFHGDQTIEIWDGARCVATIPADREV